MLDGLLTCGGGGTKAQGGGVAHPSSRSSWWAVKKHGDMRGRYALPTGPHDPQRTEDKDTCLLKVPSLNTPTQNTAAPRALLWNHQMGFETRSTPHEVSVASSGSTLRPALNDIVLYFWQ